MSLFRILLRSWLIHPISEITYLITGIALALSASISFSLYQDTSRALEKAKDIRIAILYLDPKVAKGDEPQVLNSVTTALKSESTDYLTHLELVNTETFIERIKSRYQKVADELLQIDSEIERLIPRYIAYAGPLRSGTYDSLRRIAGIEKIEFHEKRALIWTRHLQKVLGMTKIFAIVALLCGLIWLGVTLVNEYRVHFTTQKHLRRMGAHPLLQYFPALLSVGLLIAIVSMTTMTLQPKLEKRAVHFLLGDLHGDSPS